MVSRPVCKIEQFLPIAAFIATSILLQTVTAGEVMKPHLTSDDTFLAIDDSVFEKLDSLTLSICEATKYPGNPILSFEGDRDPDACRVSAPNVLRINGKYRMWYDAYGETRMFITRYAESEDGYNWVRHDDNVVNFGGHTSQPFIYYDAAEKDPGRRYKTPVFGMISQKYLRTDEQKSRYKGQQPSMRCIAYSPDGLRWTLEQGHLFPIPAKIECPLLYKMHGRWFLIHQMNNAEFPEVNPWSRFLGVSYSDDLINWKLAEEPAFCFDKRYRGVIQTHVSPAVMKYGENLIVGVVGLFIDNHELVDQEADLTLLFTNDGLHWRQPKPLRPLTTILRRGDRGSWDESFLLQGSILNTGDKTRLYYAGGHYGNASWTDHRIGAADLGLDRFGYFAPTVWWDYNEPAYAGELISKPILLREKGLILYLNLDLADSKKGSVAVELLDESSNPIPGYSLKECDSFGSDGVGVPVTWKGRVALDDLAGQKVRVRIQIKGDNPKRTPMVRTELPRLHAFYFDKPKLWLNHVTRVIPNRGQERVHYSDPTIPTVSGIRVSSQQAMQVLASHIGEDEVKLVLRGKGVATIDWKETQEIVVEGEKTVVLYK